jgi:hypothetical protein
MASASAADDERRHREYSGNAWDLMYQMPQDKLAEFGQRPEHLKVPIAVTPQSGKPCGTLSYDADQARRGFPALLVAQPSPSPLQQWVREHGPKENPAYAVGAPVRLVHMSSPATQQYNKMVGDIYNVRDTADGLAFDVRVPLFPGIMAEHQIPVSTKAMSAARENRGIIAVDYNMTREEAQNDDGSDNLLPPYIQVGNLGSEKLDPLATGAAARGITKFVMPPVWGKPLSKEELQALEQQIKPPTTRAAAPSHQGNHNQTSRGYHGPPPTIPGPCGAHGSFVGGPGPMLPGGGSMMGHPMGFPGPMMGHPMGMHPGGIMPPGMHPGGPMPPGMYPGGMPGPFLAPDMHPGMNPFATMAPFPY